VEQAIDHRHDGRLHGALAQKNLAAAFRDRGFLDTATHGGIALRVQIDKQHATLRGCQ
jgi:hypothetical protein